MASEQIAENANCPTGAEIAQVGRQFDGEGLTIAYMMGVADEKARGRAAVAELVEVLDDLAGTITEAWPGLADLPPIARAQSLISRHQAGLGKGEGG
ncbi:hypothetical protein MRBLMC3_000772 [Sphingobium sp. LMC3-1-1.1]|uniref:hypothetical protein n=1 Tax=Sphingobium sp. LMC3-1-1.1 TaxID=3135241 RepID=UPI003425639E